MAIAKKNDLAFDTIRQAVELVFEEKGVTTKDDLKYLPSREEYFERETKAMAMLKKIDESLTALTGRVSIHSNQIEALEKIHPHGMHIIVN